MKKLTSYLSLLALVSVVSAGVSPANAAPALKGFSADFAKDAAGTTITGLPAWFQDINGVAVKPCLDPARCALAGAPGFLGGVPSFPNNFPEEFFYWAGDANLVPAGASDVLIVNALEIVFVDALGNLVPANTPGAVAFPFQRLRVVHTFIGGGGDIGPAGLNFPAAGNFTVRTPWGTAVFPLSQVKCVNQGGNTKCSMTRDLPAGGPPNPTGALGDPVLAPGSISTFLKDPTAPVGFLGVGAGSLGFTGAPVGGANSFTITDPLGRTATTTDLSLVIGQTVGLEITQPAGGTDFGVVKPNGVVPPKTFIINNLTGAIVPTLAIAANVPNSNPVVASPDFTVAPSAVPLAPATVGCGATMAIGEICSFDVTFSPKAPEGPKTAAITITGGAGVPAPALMTVAGIADFTAPAVAITGIARFTKTASQTISGTVTDANGVPAVGGVKVSVDGGAPANATVTGSTWSYSVPALSVQSPTNLAPHTISVVATDNALPAPGNQSAAVTDSIVVDQTQPVVAVTLQGEGTRTKVATPALTYLVTDTNLASIIVKVDGTIITPTPVSGAALAKLADGLRTVRVEGTDSAGNTAFKEASLTVDTIVSPFTLAAVTTPTRTTTQTISGTVEAGSTVQVKVGAAAAANATVTGTAWTFSATLAEGVNNITVSGTDSLGNNTTLPATSIKIVLPDGKISGAATVAIADALKVLQFATGLNNPTAEESLHADVAPLVNGVPAPDGKIDIGDVVLILRKAVGLINF